MYREFGVRGCRSDEADQRREKGLDAEGRHRIYTG